MKKDLKCMQKNLIGQNKFNRYDLDKKLTFRYAETDNSQIK